MEQPDYRNLFEYKNSVSDNQISELDTYLEVYDLDNSFKIYTDSHNRLKFNINSSITLAIDESVLQTYVCKSVLQWPLISNKIYGTTRLSWLLQKINNVRAEDIFKNKLPGEEIKYLPIDYAASLVEIINNYNNTDKIREL